ncbi:MAG: DUF892 family protein [Planctomycetota bacterium]|nr:DUF892 family protein [Planctomycetota bacterium]
MHLDSPLRLLGEAIQIMYNAEGLLVLAMPRVAARAPDESLRRALAQHLDETRAQAIRLEQAATLLGVPCQGRRSMAMEGLLSDGELNLGYAGDDTLVSLAIIGTCSAVEHYELSMYESMLMLAHMAGSTEAAELFKATLGEEERALQSLHEASSGLQQQLRSGAAAGNGGGVR